MTCRAVYRSYYVNGQTPVKKLKTGRPPLPLPIEIVEYLRSSLFENRFLSLRERCRDVQNKFDFVLKFDRLRGFFRREGIVYKSCKFFLCVDMDCLGATVLKAAKRSPDSRKLARRDFAAKLVTLMKANKLVWLADETSVNLWSKSSLQNTW